MSQGDRRPPKISAAISALVPTTSASRKRCLGAAFFVLRYDIEQALSSISPEKFQFSLKAGIPKIKTVNHKNSAESIEPMSAL